MEWFKTVLDMACNITDVTEKFNIQEKTRTLKRKMETLASREADIRTQLDVEEMRPGKKRKVEVKNWSKNFERLRCEVDNVGQNIATSTSLWQLTLGSHLDKLIREAEQLHEAGRFSECLTLNEKETRGCELPVRKLVGQAFQSNLEEIWGYLMSEEVESIAIQGLGGVGKTTLVMHVHNRILNDLVTFESSCWITVSQDCTVRMLQDAIAKHLALVWENENNEKIRAGRLWRTLRSRKMVVILDDVWNYYDLEKVGIPLGKDGCKLIMTSRKKDLCDQMNCDKIVEVTTLPDQEAWCLFQDNLGRGSLLSPDVKKIAEEVARECAGLPLGLTVLSGIMRGVSDIHEWRSTLEELRESKYNEERMEDEVFTVLRFSYQRLSDNVMQQCFLHVALHSEDSEVDKEELIQYFIDSGLIERKRTRRAKYDKGMAILSKLVKSCLLGESEGNVRMHDLVRDMAIKEANGRFMVKAGQLLKEVPDESEWNENLEKVSLMDNNIKEIAANVSPLCHNISTLFLQGNPLVSIPDSFFWHMQTLQILNLSSTGIEELPSSFSDLGNLTTLDLSFCQNLKAVPSLAKMTALGRLKLSESGIEEIPQGMEKLHSLTYLNLHRTVCLQGEQWPIGIIPHLLHLQYLNFEWGPGIMKGEELMSLKKLECLCCYFNDEDEFNTCLKYVRSKTAPLSHWRIASRHSYSLERRGDFEFDEKKLTILNCGMEGRGESFLPPNDVNSLDIYDCKGLTSMSQWGVTFLELKACYVGRCEGMETVVNDPQQCTLFPKLRFLMLSELRNLKALILNSLQPTMTPNNCNFFSSLTSLGITYCSRIKKLLTPSLLPLLTQIETIYVKLCEQLEEIIALEDDDHDDPILHLPKLKTFDIAYLPQLKIICGAKWTMKCDSLQRLCINRCTKLERIPIDFRMPSNPHGGGDPVPSFLESVVILCVQGQEEINWKKRRPM